MAALEVRDLGFGYGEIPVWEDVSFTLQEGEVSFLVGPNGAGKSTLFKCLAGWINPDDGEILLDGVPFDGRTRLAPASLTFVGDVPSFYDDLSAAEHVDLVLAANNASDLRPRADELMERFGLASYAGLLPSSFSRGMREKLALVLALTLRPKVLLLDEPHGPLDREASALLSEELAAVASAGTAVLLSCHHDVPGLAADQLLELRDGALAVSRP